MNQNTPPQTVRTPAWQGFTRFRIVAGTARQYLAILLALTVINVTGIAQTGNSPGAVYAMTNEAAGNRIAVFNRAANGTLTPGGSFATGGLGSGTFENTANGLILTGQSPDNVGGGNRIPIRDQRWQ